MSSRPCAALGFPGGHCYYGTMQKEEMDSGGLIEELETKIAYQEKTIEELSSSVYDHEQRIEKLERNLKELAQKFKELAVDGLPPLPANERPPHY